MDDAQIDIVINDLEQVRQRLIAKYGPSFGNLSVNAQIEVVKLVYKVASGAAI